MAPANAPQDELSGFFGPQPESDATHQPAANPPQPAAPASPPAAEEAPESGRNDPGRSAAEEPALPSHLVDRAKRLGISQAEINRFRDPEHLSYALNMLVDQRLQATEQELQQLRAGKQPQQQAPAAGEQADDIGFPDVNTLDAQEYGQQLIDYLAGTRKALQNLEKRIPKFDQESFATEIAPTVEKMIGDAMTRQHAIVQAQNDVRAALTAAGHSESMLEDPGFIDRFSKLASGQRNAHLDAGLEPPSVRELADMFIPKLLGQQRPAAPQQQRAPGYQQQAPAAQRPTQQRNERGQFASPPVGAPTHSESPLANGGHLRGFFHANNVDPGPEDRTPDVNLNGFLGK